MGRLASIAASIVILSAIAASLGGCGYRELKAPCGPEEGRPPALSYAPVAQVPITGSPLDRLGVGSMPVSDPCGPLRPINNGLATATARSPGDEAP